MAAKIHEPIKSADVPVQKAHYNRIILEYERHYGDKHSQSYREEFIYRHLFEGVDFRQKTVLEAMCGTGETTGYLVKKGAVVTALDISDGAIDIFRKKWPKCKGRYASVYESGFPAESFDIVVVMFGFHHVHPDTDRAIEEIHRVLKRGGLLCFVEPHAGSLLDMPRRFWYRRDKLFAENENSINLEEMKKKWARRFKFTSERYGRGLAYLIVYNSMILRVPHAIKKYYAAPLCMLEKIFNWLHGKFLSGFVMCRWEKI